MTDAAPPPQRMTTREVLDALTRERADLLAAVDALGDRASSAPVTPEGWTAHDVLGHLIHWAGQVAFVLGADVTPPPYLAGVQGRPSGEEWNALATAHHRARPFADVRAEFVATSDAIVEAVALRSDEAINATGAVPWRPDHVLWEFIGGDTFLHWSAHTAALRRAAAEG